SALVLISAASFTLNVLCSRLRMASRVSGVAKSLATALTSSLACGFWRASSIAHPPAMPSFIRPKQPLGSDAVTAMLETITLLAIWLHSSAVKLVLLAIALLLCSRERTLVQDAASVRGCRYLGFDARSDNGNKTSRARPSSVMLNQFVSSRRALSFNSLRC